MGVPQPRPNSRGSSARRRFLPPGARLWSGTSWLIIANVVVFVLSMRHGVLTTWGAFSAASLIRGQAWRIITYQFLHGGPGHLFCNMIALYFFGPIAEGWLGR